jgi:hypothetical protein
LRFFSAVDKIISARKLNYLKPRKYLWLGQMSKRVRHSILFFRASVLLFSERLSIIQSIGQLEDLFDLFRVCWLLSHSIRPE